ncbi:MAG: hypothetical protein ACRCX2_20200 [Paraclostridium sp.]
MLELYEGKMTVDITNLDELTRHYLVEFKDELNQHINSLKNNKAPNNSFKDN